MGQKFKIILEIHVFKKGTSIEVSHPNEMSDQDLKHYLRLALIGMGELLK